MRISNYHAYSKMSIQDTTEWESEEYMLKENTTRQEIARHGILKDTRVSERGPISGVLL